jgi:hypothetical protein
MYVIRVVSSCGVRAVLKRNPPCYCDGDMSEWPGMVGAKREGRRAPTSLFRLEDLISKHARADHVLFSAIVLFV